MNTTITNDNLIFLKKSDLDTPIYRIFSFSRLEEILTEQKMPLLKPKCWDDPFENFILRSTGILDDGREIRLGFQDSFYGQCWSLTDESDAMWRIYSPHKDGVKVKTTIRKLFEPFFIIGGEHKKLNGNIYNLNCFIGKVKYYGVKTLTKMLTDKKRMGDKIYDQSGWGQASTFFFKRLAFKHEKEVRLMYNHQNDTDTNVFKFEFNPFTVFDEIIFDPRMTDSEYNMFKAKLIGLGYTNPIGQSELYKLPSLKLSLPFL